jgi:hypothetical protein
VFKHWRVSPSTSGRTRGATPTASGTVEFFRVVKKIGVSKARELLESVEAYENA